MRRLVFALLLIAATASALPGKFAKLTFLGTLRSTNCPPHSIACPLFQILMSSQNQVGPEPLGKHLKGEHLSRNYVLSPLCESAIG